MNPIDEYLKALTSELKVSKKAKERILAETEDHLRERAEWEEARGAGPAAAETAAVLGFGPAETVAGDFVVEQATHAARRAFWWAVPSMALVVFIAGVAATSPVGEPGLGVAFLLVVGTFIFAGLTWPVAGLVFLMTRRRGDNAMKASGCMTLAYGSLAISVFAIVYASAWNDELGLSETVMVGAASAFTLFTAWPVLQAIRLGYRARTVERAGAIVAYEAAIETGAPTTTKAPVGLFEVRLDPERKPAYVNATKTARRTSLGVAASAACAVGAVWCTGSFFGNSALTIGGPDGIALGEYLPWVSYGLFIGSTSALSQNVGISALPSTDLRSQPAWAIASLVSALGCGAVLLASGITPVQELLLAGALASCAFSLVQAARGIPLTKRIREDEAREEADARLAA